MDLGESRDELAEMAYESFDFSPRTVESRSDWRRNGDSWTREVTFAPESAGARAEPGHFTVLFGPGKAWIEESYGWSGGEILERGRGPSRGR